MTAKVASLASPAEDLACRGPLKAKRSLYTKDQLPFTHQLLQTHTKQGRSVVCVFHVDADGFNTCFVLPISNSSLVDDFNSVDLLQR